MKRRMNGILSLLLSLCLVLGLLSGAAVQVHAEDESTVAAWADANDNGVIDEGETAYTDLNDAFYDKVSAIKLYTDVVEDDQMCVFVPTVLDLNGHTLSTSEGYVHLDFFSFIDEDEDDEEYPDLTVKNGTILSCHEGDSVFWKQEVGTLILDGVTVAVAAEDMLQYGCICLGEGTAILRNSNVASVYVDAGSIELYGENTVGTWKVITGMFNVDPGDIPGFDTDAYEIYWDEACGAWVVQETGSQECTEHAFDEEYYYRDSTGHYRECDFCEYYDPESWESHDCTRDFRHSCSVCGYYDSTLCYDQNNDHLCDLPENCGNRLTGLCSDISGDHFCDICERRMVWLCIDDNNDHLCDICEEWMDWLCIDDDSDHLCDTCEEEVSQCCDDDDDGYCDICDEELTQAVTARYTALNYTYDEDAEEVLASGTLEITAMAPGTVTVRWEVYGEETADIAEADVPVEIGFEGVPVWLLEEYEQFVFEPADDSETLEDYLFQEYSLLRLRVEAYGPFDESINGRFGMNTWINEMWCDKLPMLPGADAKVELNLQPGDSYEVDSGFELAYTDNGEGTITLTLPDETGTLLLKIACTHDRTMCVDENGDHECDSDICGRTFPVVDTDDNNICDVCGMGVALRSDGVKDCALSDLIYSAANGDTVKLLADYTIEYNWEDAIWFAPAENITVTLDLNGFTLAAEASAYLLGVAETGTVKIVDSSAGKTGAVTGGTKAVFELYRYESWPGEGEALLLGGEEQHGGVIDLSEYPDPSGLTVHNNQRVPAAVSGHTFDATPVRLLLPEGYAVSFEMGGKTYESTLIPAGTVATVVKQPCIVQSGENTVVRNAHLKAEKVMIAGYVNGQMKAVQVVESVTEEIVITDEVLACTAAEGGTLRVFLLDAGYAPRLPRADV